MPRLGRGKYDLQACLEWNAKARPPEVRRKGPGAGQQTSLQSELTAERVRLTKIQADAAAYRLECERGLFIHHEAVAAALANLAQELVLTLDTFVDSAPSTEEMNRRRDCAWTLRELLGRSVESVCADSASFSESQTTGLRNRRQLR